MVFESFMIKVDYKIILLLERSMNLKKIKSYLILLILFNTYAYTLDYKVDMNWQRDKQNYKQQVQIKDRATNEIIKEINLSDSYKKEALFFMRENASLAFFYTEPKSLKGPKGLIQIVDLGSLTISHEIIVDKITRTKVRQDVLTYMAVAKDGIHLIAQIGKGRNQKLININGETGVIEKSISLGRKKIIVKNVKDIEYILTRYAKNSKGNILKIYEANTLDLVQDILITGKFVSLSHYKDYLFIKEKIVNSKQPEENKFNLKIINVKIKKVYKSFSSSKLPFEFIFKQEDIYLIGRSLTSPNYLKIVKIEDGVFKDISVKKIDAIPEVLKGYQENNELILMIFGESSVVKFNILEPKKSIKVETPFKIEGGIVSKDLNKVYVNANFGAKIGLIDFEKNQFVGSDHTGSKAKKVGNVLFNLAVMAATGAATGVAYAPGFKLSSNAMMLSLNQRLLFAINVKTDDVSVFNAENLSNKKIYPTGKRTFQILQARHEEDLPVVIISQKMVSFFDSTTGELIHSQKYDSYIKTTDDLNLIYKIDGKQARISLFDKTKW